MLAGAAFWASLSPIPDPQRLRSRLLSKDAEWSYEEGELFVIIKTKVDDKQYVTAPYEDGTPILEEPGGSLGFSIHYYNGVWY